MSVVVTLGPVPAKLDSVKYISNTTNVRPYRRQHIDTPDDKIQHILVDSFYEIFVHEFYAYGVEHFKALIPGVSIKTYNKNSILLTYGICDA